MIGPTDLLHPSPAPNFKWSRYLLKNVGYRNWILASIWRLINHRINFWEFIPRIFVYNNILGRNIYAVFLFQLVERSYVSWSWRWKIHPKLSYLFTWLHTVLCHYTIILAFYHSEHAWPHKQYRRSIPPYIISWRVSLSIRRMIWRS
jgi:hypothetical protein